RFLEMTRARPLEHSERRRRIRSLNSSLEQLARIDPAFCTRYLDAWERDRTRWQRHLDSLPSRIDWPEIPRLLTRLGEPSLTWSLRIKPPVAASAWADACCPRAGHDHQPVLRSNR